VFSLYYVSRIIYTDILKIDGVFYNKDSNSKQNDGFIGFFDWLRTDEHTIVGIRICYFENQPYNKLLTSLPYIRPTFESKCAELLFEERTYTPDISGDQDFTNNYVFKSEGGDYLFTFGLDHLTDKELNSLLNHCTVLPEDSLVSY
jgi:hypothetical protein